MGFIPFPLAVVLVKALYHSLSFKNFGSIVLFIVAYLCLFTCRVLNTICTLGKACDIMQKHQDDKIAEKLAASHQVTGSIIKSKPSTVAGGKTDSSTSPLHSKPPHQSPTVSSSTPSPIRVPLNLQTENLKIDSTLGATALFSNSDVDLEDMGILNSKVIEQNVEEKIQSMDESLRAGSEPDLVNEPSSDDDEPPPDVHRRRSHKRSESEPFIQLETLNPGDRL